MIIYTMSEKEIREELLLDMASMMIKLSHEQNAYRRRVIKATRFPLLAGGVRTSPRKNRWVVLQCSESKKEIDGKEKRKFACIVNDSKARKSAYEHFIYSKGHWILRFSAHFFDRYKERMDLEEKGEELIKVFFSNNRKYMLAIDSLIISEDVEYQAVIFMEEGVGLGKIQGSMVMIATFLPTRFYNKGLKELYKQYESTAVDSWVTRQEFLQRIRETGVLNISDYGKDYFLK